MIGPRKYNPLLSPVEHEPDFVSGIGLITSRWAALERQMAETLGQLFKVESAGPPVYYALGNFSQRLDLLRTACRSSFISSNHAEITDSLFEKIARLWKARNYLIHSHYVYIKKESGGHQSVVLTSEPDAPHPSNAVYGASFGQPLKPLPEGYAYVRRKPNGGSELVSVNKGTFDNHAAQLSKRVRQVAVLNHVLLYEMVPLQRTTWSGLPSRLPPRSRLDQMGPLIIKVPVKESK